MIGTIKTKTDRGFGFIASDEAEKDIFFHSSDLSGVTFEQLEQGAKVEFDVEDGDRGQSAKNIKLV